MKREWLGLEGHIQALNSNCGTYLNLSAQQTRASMAKFDIFISYQLAVSISFSFFDDGL